MKLELEAHPSANTMTKDSRKISLGKEVMTFRTSEKISSTNDVGLYVWPAKGVNIESGRALLRNTAALPQSLRKGFAFPGTLMRFEAMPQREA